MARATPEATMRSVLDAYAVADGTALRVLAAPDVRWLEERTGVWKEGVAGLIDSARVATEGTTGFRVDVGEARTIDLGGHAVVSAGLTFSFVYDGAPFRIACPATFVFEAVPDGWRLVHQHTLALPTADDTG